LSQGVDAGQRPLWPEFPAGRIEIPTDFLSIRYWAVGRPHFHNPVVSGSAVSLGTGDGEGLGYNDSGGIPKCR
jgi:hypothetical protein